MQLQPRSLTAELACGLSQCDSVHQPFVSWQRFLLVSHRLTRVRYRLELKLLLTPLRERDYSVKVFYDQ